MRNIKLKDIGHGASPITKATQLMNRLFFISFVACVILFSGCSKLVEIGPPRNSISSTSVFTDQAGTNAAIAGMYASLYNYTTSYQYGISLLSGLQADEMVYNGTTWDQYKNNDLLSNESNVAGTWSGSYSGIYQANAIIEGVSSSNFPAAYKSQVTGEALFMRAFCHFYLVNLFGDVPLTTSTSVLDNQQKPRTPADQVYTQIITDLEEAEKLLPEAYPSGNNRTRVNKYAAAALLARVYLYQKNYKSAEAKATEVINAMSGSSLLYALPADLSMVFLNASTETIWCFDDAIYGYTWVGGQTLPNTNVIPNFILLQGLQNAFEVGDKRKVSWVGVSAGQSYPYKYRTKTNVKQEYDVVLRLAEQYLIRAEARALLNNIEGGQADVNVIRNRAGLQSLTLTASSILPAIAQERRVELFSEWGHRWLDLKRTGKVDSVIGALKPGLWQSTDALYPIPLNDMSNNTNLVQNQGYF
ncbi:RagB/SusD family nutrient uptake outer membrane protein [Pinibacter aurantiacus]|uniref:RagB/SusD family nutrient uptake outer membrane protein n=1 Tax=Pinibacter aurantiacus TaxID=2851599 RepID=A0A9E2W2F9_9BACT|nr:RagB/SusD family nutrient uptake outer membrane protein [Pinibacter aurantiacus]MBV4357285.1 RagB/SusD family nutrient uptake outer membrane protein [Pinibacter aurantiacus]